MYDTSAFLPCSRRGATFECLRTTESSTWLWSRPRKELSRSPKPSARRHPLFALGTTVGENNKIENAYQEKKNHLFPAFNDGDGVDSEPGANGCEKGQRHKRDHPDFMRRTLANAWRSLKKLSTLCVTRKNRKQNLSWDMCQGL